MALSWIVDAVAGTPTALARLTPAGWTFHLQPAPPLEDLSLRRWAQRMTSASGT